MGLYTELQIKRLYRELCKKVTASEKLVLKLMAHPEATPAHLWEMHESYSRLAAQMRRIKHTLLQKGIINF